MSGGDVLVLLLNNHLRYEKDLPIFDLPQLSYKSFWHMPETRRINGICQLKEPDDKALTIQSDNKKE
ncbi:hypothetical protein EDI28_07165 [Photobacterium chitinilyticum]|uniref:Uncharacterized protein n=1 Tax=Photobacterium chitinilyticum TaxID=2485123 RepID=A0A3S3QQF2_9GAMM|nr:hypothetical protein EDI28_07165 [Photobacterium chitinilyticum]